MASGHDAQVAGEKVEALLAELRSNAGPQVAETAEELVSCLVELYGAGLAEIVKIVGSDRGAGPRLLDGWSRTRWWRACCWCMTCTRSTGARVQRAIDQVLPQFGSHAGQVSTSASTTRA
jgi:hypothetical protein